MPCARLSVETGQREACGPIRIFCMLQLCMEFGYAEVETMIMAMTIAKMQIAPEP